MEPVGNLERLRNKREAHEERLKVDYHDPNFKFAAGSYVWKPKGYPFEGTVVSAFQTMRGNYRYVVESKLSPGLLHIFNGSQLEDV